MRARAPAARPLTTAGRRGPPELSRSEAQFIGDYLTVFVGVKAKLMAALAHNALAVDAKSKE